MAEGIKPHSSERLSGEYLAVNACGVEHIRRRDRGSNRVYGRVDYHILYIERGVCRVFLDGEWRAAEAGSIILFRPHEPQIYRYFAVDQSLAHYYHFSGVGCERLLSRLGIDGLQVFMMGRDEVFEETSRKMVKEFSQKEAGYEDFCAAYMYQLLNRIGRAHASTAHVEDSRAELRIRAVCRRICENIQSPPSAWELAAECCLSLSRFSHLFHEVMGCSMTDFIAETRISRAKEMLSYTDLPIREIAEAVGYGDQNYFTRCFRQREGCSPRVYRGNSESAAKELEVLKNTRAPFQILAIPYQRQSGRLLYCVLRRSDGGGWQFIAGGGAHYEDPTQTARREIAEKSGQRGVSLISLRSTCSISVEAIPNRHLCRWSEDTYVIPEYAYGFECVGEIVLSNENAEVAWLPYEEARKRVQRDSNKTALYELNCILEKQNEK